MMTRTHILTAFRNIQKQPLYTALNIIGLATGIAAGLIIAIYIRNELSFDTSFPEYRNIYRVHFKERAESSPLMAVELDENFSEVDQAARLSFFGKRVIVSESSVPIEATGYFADPTFLQLFGIRVDQGNGEKSLATSNTVVISRSMALKLFNDERCVGKVLKLDNRRELIVGAVMEDLPSRSHMKFDFLVSINEFYSNTDDRYLKNKLWSSMYSYVRIPTPEAYATVSSGLKGFTERFFNGLPEKDYMVSEEGIQLMKLKDIHLHSNLAQEMRPNGSAVVVYLLTVVEILILVIACINFISMFTTQALKRMKQIGMRRIMGATSGNLTAQILTEVTFIVASAVILSVVLYQAIIPIYNSVSGSSLEVWEIMSIGNVTILGLVAIGICTLCGVIPALFVINFKPASFLRDSKMRYSFFGRMRNGLVVFQFAVSIFLIAATILVGRQVQFIQNKSLGFNKDQVVSIPLNGYLWYRAVHEAETFNAALLKNKGVISMGITSNMIGDDLGVEGAIPLGQEKEDWPAMRMMAAGNGFVETLDLQLVEGRAFSALYNDTSSVILNESAVKALHLKNPIGQVLVNDFQKTRHNIIGVVKDFHFASLHHAVEPLVIQYQPEWSKYLVVRLSGESLDETLASVVSSLKQEAPHSLVTYQFLNDKVSDLYQYESSLARIFQFFSVLGLTIAALGLISLCAFTIESKTKEIGIRKVMGATIGGILSMVSGSFAKLIVIAFLLAAPVTWYSFEYWLQSFAYQVEHDWLVYPLTAAIVLSIAALATGLHMLKAALANPVDALRYE